MATPTPTPTSTALPASAADDAVDAMLAAWNVVLSMPGDAAEPTSEALQAIDDVTVDGSDAAAFLQTRAELLTAVEARGDVIGAPLDDFESTADSFTVTACLSIEATSVADDSVVGNGTWSAFDVAGTVVDGQLQLDGIANVAVADPDATPVPIDDQDPSEPAPDACVPPTQQVEILERTDGFVDAYATYSLDTSSQEARGQLETFTTAEDLLFPYEDSFDIRGLMREKYITKSARDAAVVFYCQDPSLVPDSSAPLLVWKLNLEQMNEIWMVVSAGTYGQPERSLLVPHAWETCFGQS